MKNKLTARELSSFCGQMGMLLHSGISTAEGLHILCDESKTDADRQILTPLIRSVDATKVSESFSPRYLPNRSFFTRLISQLFAPVLMNAPQKCAQEYSTAITATEIFAPNINVGTNSIMSRHKRRMSANSTVIRLLPARFS